MPERLPPSLDGVSAPLPASPVKKDAGVTPPKPRSPARFLTIVLCVIGGVYVVGGMILLSMFPTADVRLWPLRSLGYLLYLVGLFFWLGLGVFAAYRVASYKPQNQKTQIKALLRIGAFEVPVLLVSILVLALINGDPSLTIDIISPQGGTLVAPVSLEFGTQTAAQVFRREQQTPLRYSWDFDGDGKVDQTTTEPTITAYYPRSGIFRVTATVEFASSKRVLRRTITIPRQVFAVEPQNPIIDEPATFSLSHLFKQPEKEFKSAQWDFDADGSIDVESELLDVTYTYHRLGAVEPKVIITYASDATTQITREVMVVEALKQPFPISIATLPPTPLGTAPFGVVFRINTEEDIANVTWTFGDQGTSEEPIAQRVFSKVGNYPVTAIVRSQSGAIARVTKLVQVTEPLVLRDLKFTGTPEMRGNVIEGEQPLTVDVTPQTSQPLVTFAWDAPDASEIVSTEKTLRAVFRKVGEWKVELIGIDAEQKVLRMPITINVVPPKSEVSISVNPETPIAPATVTFDASDTFIPGKKITGYEWSFGNGKTEPLGAITDYFFEEAGTYRVRVLVKTLDGGQYSAEKSLVVRAPLNDICFLPSRISGTAPLGVRFDTSCSTSGFTSFTWDFGDGAQSDEPNPIHIFEREGEYTVRLRGTDAKGTATEKSLIITVSAP